MTQGLPLRKDVPKQETWDLKDLFINDEAFYETLNQVLKSSKSLILNIKINLLTLRMSNER